MTDIKKWFMGLVVFVLYLSTAGPVLAASNPHRPTYWSIQSIDTVKYSRDLAREKNKDPNFDAVIESQIKQIAETGATHVAIATPYDEEFLPFLKRWVTAARKYNLNVWYRGNWSGWEKWFGYQSITPKQHLAQTVQFIKQNKDMFVDGDIFSPCPECENGGPGDPRYTGKITEFQTFLIDLTQACETAAAEIGRQISCNIHSMNGDVAQLVMDPTTTKKLGGVVVVDHYVQSPQQLVADLKQIAQKSQGKIILGEFGAPIPDLHGSMTELEQAQWIRNALLGLLDTPEVIGVNYWTNVGGSSSLWDSHNQARLAVKELTTIFKPNEITIETKNRVGESVPSSVKYVSRIFTSDENGLTRLPKRVDQYQMPAMIVSAAGYKDQGVSVGVSQTETVIIMQKNSENLLFKLRSLLYYLSHSIITK